MLDKYLPNMTEPKMNLRETFFAEGMGAVMLAFAGLKLEDISTIASTGANFLAMAVSCIAIYTFIRKERRERKKD